MNHFNLYEVLIKCVIDLSPKSYLEIGVQEGLSLSTVIKADAKKLIDRIALCDTWGSQYGGTGRGNHDHILKILQSINYQGEVVFHDGDSKATIPQIIDKYDLILVDGDHSENGALVDMTNAWPLLNSQGIMLVDDIIHPVHSYLMDVVSKFVGANAKEVESVSYYTDKPNGVAVIKKL